MLAALLLGIGVLIALIGTLNTLRLTAIERHQVIGLQRALGLPRFQVRAAITYESVMLSIFGGVIRVVLGSPVAIVGAYSLANNLRRAAVRPELATGFLRDHPGPRHRRGCGRSHDHGQKSNASAAGRVGAKMKIAPWASCSGSLEATAAQGLEPQVADLRAVNRSGH
ncbi:FtsX-like permease family protein [Nesterenkonia rhizosphaerae]|uniref:FtsX-like permease family protein n=1 Tax=Nesterenkonia rhizosphaerae TaxID=1348272 RepID=UPI003CD09BA9